ncbi:MAG: PorP/SprF family type IX secretion system membrane protein [Marinifilaceae bacterium]|jgi:type IX secretion system PorP/SprF family membrane protein|nr:PorP/SprF family type IX secretion system membrane protein [Marinifilaceae bacterium]
MFKKNKLIILLCLIFELSNINAQPLPLIYHQEYSLHYNPAFSLYYNYAKIDVYNRVQSVNSNQDFRTLIVHGSVPIYKDNDSDQKSVLSISFLSDNLNSGKLMKEENMNFALSHQISISDYHILGLGIEWSSFQRFFDTHNFNTGSQYIIGKGFSADLPNNETVESISGGYSIWTTGMILSNKKNVNRDSYFLGLSCINMTGSKYGSDSNANSRLKTQWGVQFVYEHRISDEISLSPDIDIKYTKDDKWANIGFRAEYSWLNPAGGFLSKAKICLHPRYVYEKAYGVGLEFSQTTISFRYARTISNIKHSNFHLNTNEISFSFHNNFKFAKKLKRNKKLNKSTQYAIRPIEVFVWNDEYWNYKDIQQHDILDESLQKYINSILEYLNQHNETSLRIFAHTDMHATDIKNKDVSLRRAELIANYIISKGIDKSRIDYFGMGNSKKLKNNAFGQERLNNRRVEFKIYKGKILKKK